MLAREITIQYRDRPDLPPAPDDIIGTTTRAIAWMQEIIGHEIVETMIAVYLSTGHQVIGHAIIGRGNLSACPVSVAAVFAPAMLANAAGVIIAHNHPSGNPRPSPDDVAFTARMHAAGQLLGIQLLDHIVIGHPSGVSMRDSATFKF